ncbi:hypothetical protein NPIL_275121 [Nephila pilipes]|uniref:Uncharacterized protein n=1 Tax=Nephila pilipes TaxID=299642 RepID=A0A8X6MS62_NEPPI|nr:hypothetical protein NPIL_275121 [Nephila pilipes]
MNHIHDVLHMMDMIHGQYTVDIFKQLIVIRVADSEQHSLPSAKMARKKNRVVTLFSGLKGKSNLKTERSHFSKMAEDAEFEKIADTAECAVSVTRHHDRESQTMGASN